MYITIAIFIIIEIAWFISMVEVAKNLGYTQLEKDYKDKFTKKELSDISKLANKATPNVIMLIYSIYTITTIICFTIGLFKPFWYLSILYLLLFLIDNIKIQKKKENFDCFVSTKDIENVSLQRKIKLDIIDSNSQKRKTKILLISYLYSFIKISIYTSIIILHFHYNYF